MKNTYDIQTYSKYFKLNGDYICISFYILILLKRPAVKDEVYLYPVDMTPSNNVGYRNQREDIGGISYPFYFVLSKQSQKSIFTFAITNFGPFTVHKHDNSTSFPPLLFLLPAAQHDILAVANKAPCNTHHIWVVLDRLLGIFNNFYDEFVVTVFRFQSTESFMFTTEVKVFLYILEPVA